MQYLSWHGVLSKKHGQDALATLADRGFCKGLE